MLAKFCVTMKQYGIAEQFSSSKPLPLRIAIGGYEEDHS